jgi:hypothetical protein
MQVLRHTRALVRAIVAPLLFDFIRLSIRFCTWMGKQKDIKHHHPGGKFVCSPCAMQLSSAERAKIVSRSLLACMLRPMLTFIGPFCL